MLNWPNRLRRCRPCFFLILFSLLMLSMLFIMLPRAAASADRINEVLDLEPEINDAPTMKETEGEGGYISFQNVTFSYPGAEEPALQDISFSARPGQVTAIIGGTGSGKSTLINLIPRFYDPTSGAMRPDARRATSTRGRRRRCSARARPTPG